MKQSYAFCYLNHFLLSQFFFKENFIYIVLEKYTHLGDKKAFSVQPELGLRLNNICFCHING